jgi:transposase
LVKGQRVVTFLDESLRLSEETDYLMRIKSHPDKYNEEGFYARIHRFGTLSLVSYLPDELSPEQLYQAYKQRNQIETMFDSYKNFLEADKTYMQDRFVLEGWLMANFIAMMAYYRLFIRLKEAGIQSKYSPKDITEISKSIYQTKIGQNWRTSEITKKVSELFAKLNIDYLK